MSSRPCPPALVEVKYKVNPSREIAGPLSLALELIPGTGVGVDHPKYRGFAKALDAETHMTAAIATVATMLAPTGLWFIRFLPLR